MFRFKRKKQVLPAMQKDYLEEPEHRLTIKPEVDISAYTPKEAAIKLYQEGEIDLNVISVKVKRAPRTVRRYIQEYKSE